MQARLGEVLYITANAEPASADRYLSESIRRFSRSIELCDDYLRGYYGLKLVRSLPSSLHSWSHTNIAQSTSKLMSAYPKSNKQKNDADLPIQDMKTIQGLNQLATAKLHEIVRHGIARDAGWEGYDSAELIAAQALLDLDTTPKSR